MVLSSLQTLVNGTGLAAPDNGLDALQFAEYGFCDRLILMELRRVLPSKQAEERSTMAELRDGKSLCVQLKEHSEAPHVAIALVHHLAAKLASFATGIELPKVERDTSASCIQERDVAAETHNRKLVVVVPAMRPLMGCVAAGEGRANSTEAPALETTDKMSQLRTFVGGLNLPIGSARAHVAGLVDAELVRGWSFNTAALLESEGMVSVAK